MFVHGYFNSCSTVYQRLCGRCCHASRRCVVLVRLCFILTQCFFSQIFLSSPNNLHSGFSFSITFILVVITVAEDFECLIFFLWRAELWEFNWVGNDTDCMLRHIRNSQLANCFCIRSVVSPSVWFFVKSNSIQSLLCTDVIGLPQGWTPGQPKGL